MESVESLCNTLARSKVLEGDLVRNLRGRWREQAGDKIDKAGEFKRWLVRTGQVTDFQLDMLTRGFADHLFFDDYKLQDKIGKGRMAGVYKAVHSSGQVVAIKVLPPSKAKDPQLLGRFLRESRLAVKLEHDNVVRTFHDGQNKDGMHYIAMEFLDGETLEETLQRRKRLPMAEAVPLMVQVLEGLNHLDEKGLVHRDLKPANLMLVPAPDSGQADTTAKSTVKILDIGLSRALFDEGDATGADADLTREGTLLGTTNYMAPEQARDAHNADIRSDIYSLGCVLYEMLSGQPPFVEANLARQIRKHAEEPPRPLTEKVPGTSEQLDAIVQKMLAKDPAMRYPTPGQALKDLRKLQTAQAVAPKPPKPLRSFLTWLETKEVQEPTPLGAKPKPPEPAAKPVSLVAVPVPVPIPAPAPKPAAVVNPAPIVAAPVPVPAPVPVAVPKPVAVASPTPAVPKPVVTAAPAPAAPVAATQAKTPPAPATPQGSVPDPGGKAIELLRDIGLFVKNLRRRDWICMGAGAGILLLMQLVWGLMRR